MHDTLPNSGQSLPSLPTLSLSPPSGMLLCLLQCILVATITKTKSVHDLCVVIEAGYLSELITLDLQCIHCSFSSLPDSRITDRNVRFLCEALQSGNCSKLRTLRLSNNAMSVAGCGSLATCLSLGCLQELRSLDLQRTEFPSLSHRQPALRRRHQQARSILPRVPLSQPPAHRLLPLPHGESRTPLPLRGTEQFSAGRSALSAHLLEQHHRRRDEIACAHDFAGYSGLAGAAGSVKWE